MEQEGLHTGKERKKAPSSDYLGDFAELSVEAGGREVPLNRAVGIYLENKEKQDEFASQRKLIEKQQRLEEELSKAVVTDKTGKINKDRLLKAVGALQMSDGENKTLIGYIYDKAKVDLSEGREMFDKLHKNPDKYDAYTDNITTEEYRHYASLTDDKEIEAYALYLCGVMQQRYMLNRERAKLDGMIKADTFRKSEGFYKARAESIKGKILAVVEKNIEYDNIPEDGRTLAAVDAIDNAELDWVDKPSDINPDISDRETQYGAELTARSMSREINPKSRRSKDVEALKRESISMVEEERAKMIMGLAIIKEGTEKGSKAMIELGEIMCNEAINEHNVRVKENLSRKMADKGRLTDVQKPKINDVVNGLSRYYRRAVNSAKAVRTR